MRIYWAAIDNSDRYVIYTGKGKVLANNLTMDEFVIAWNRLNYKV